MKICSYNIDKKNFENLPSGYEILDNILEAETILFCKKTDDDFNNIFNKTANNFIEISADHLCMEQFIDNIASCTKDAININLFSSTAYYTPISHLIVDYTFKKLGITQNTYRRNNIITALHEAISNAIIHGNLMIDNDFNNIQEFCEYSLNVNKSIQDPNLMHKRICISCSISKSRLSFAISDEGKSLRDVGNNNSKAKFHGRGMVIIKQLCSDVELENNKITLLFDLL
jgi:anti-sigma regulatory factor (Ser/Thr protein kinase)